MVEYVNATAGTTNQELIRIRDFKCDIIHMYICRCVTYCTYICIMCVLCKCLSIIELICQCITSPLPQGLQCTVHIHWGKRREKSVKVPQMT